jgi:hypothetical protein
MVRGCLSPRAEPLELSASSFTHAWTGCQPTTHDEVWDHPLQAGPERFELSPSGFGDHRTQPTLDPKKILERVCVAVSRRRPSPKGGALPAELLLLGLDVPQVEATIARIGLFGHGKRTRDNRGARRHRPELQSGGGGPVSHNVI